MFDGTSFSPGDSAWRLLNRNSRSVVSTEKGVKAYPPSHVLPFSSFRRPEGEKARWHAEAECWDEGRMREVR
jgi:hypothetical protein